MGQETCSPHHSSDVSDRKEQRDRNHMVSNKNEFNIGSYYRKLGDPGFRLKDPEDNR